MSLTALIFRNMKVYPSEPTRKSTAIWSTFMTISYASKRRPINIPHASSIGVYSHAIRNIIPIVLLTTSLEGIVQIHPSKLIHIVWCICSSRISAPFITSMPIRKESFTITKTRCSQAAIDFVIEVLDTAQTLIVVQIQAPIINHVTLCTSVIFTCVVTRSPVWVPSSSTIETHTLGKACAVILITAILFTGEDVNESILSHIGWHVVVV